MRDDFETPEGLRGRFGVVKLWPDIKVAEDEVIARLRKAAQVLGLECVVVDHMGKTIDPPYRQMTQDDLDFIISLHFSTPKSYDVFSFVVLWNPLQFFHDFGYRRVVRNLPTHDDFLSCSSPMADDQIRRLTANDPTRAEPHFTMYHSVAEPILRPTLGDRKLFYSGINWERLGKGGSRHQEVLDELDMTGELRIYGPRLLRGVRVWEGYKSYQGSLPFDGVSMMREINRAGIALVLSSEAHKDAELMSNRLFEGLAGGAVVVCDEHPFARRHFGDSLLYVDLTAPPDEAAEQILQHVRWIKANPEDALALAARAQSIFERDYRLDRSLRRLYDGLTARRAELERRYAPADPDLPVALFLLLPEYDAATVNRQLANASRQTHQGCKPVLVVDEFDNRHFAPELRKAIAESGADVAIETAAFFARDQSGRIIRRSRLGSVLAGLLAGARADLFCVVAPDEELYSNHVQTLAGALSRHPEAGYAHANVLLRHQDSAGETICDLHEKLNFFDHTPIVPLGHGRFLFRLGALAGGWKAMLPYLDVNAMLGLALYGIGTPTRRTTGMIELQLMSDGRTRGAKPRAFDESMREELEIVRDFDPDSFDRMSRLSTADTARPPAPAIPQATEHLFPESLYIDRLSRKNRQILLAQLLQSLPLPRFVWAMLRPLRPWRREARPPRRLPPPAAPADRP